MSDNPFLSPVARKRLQDRYEGTRLGRQELYGILLEDNPDALWTEDMIHPHRISPTAFEKVQLKRTVVAIDPAVTSTKSSNSTGIVTCAMDNQKPEHFYVIADDTIVGRPDEWSRQAIKAYRTHQADRIIGEVNNGGEMIESTLRQIDNRIPYKAVRASKGKMLRAEPISALYEKYRVHHVGNFPLLETQMLEYDGDTTKTSPDRLDALVWALTELSGGKKRGFSSW